MSVNGYMSRGLGLLRYAGSLKKDALKLTTLCSPTCKLLKTKKPVWLNAEQYLVLKYSEHYIKPESADPVSSSAWRTQLSVYILRETSTSLILHSKTYSWNPYDLDLSVYLQAH